MAPVHTRSRSLPLRSLIQRPYMNCLKSTACLPSGAIAKTIGQTWRAEPEAVRAVYKSHADPHRQRVPPHYITQATSTGLAAPLT